MLSDRREENPGLLPCRDSQNSACSGSGRKTAAVTQGEILGPALLEWQPLAHPGHTTLRNKELTDTQMGGYSLLTPAAPQVLPLKLLRTVGTILPA